MSDNYEKEELGRVRADHQSFVLKLAKKCCNQMYVGTLIKMHKWLESMMDDFCPEWRKLYE